MTEHTEVDLWDAQKVFSDMEKEVVEYVHYNGWRVNDTTFAEYVALLHSEVSEMLEEWRNKDFAEVQLEFADVLIRLLDMSEKFGINLVKAFRDKMDKNWQRPYQHGGKTLLWA